MAFFGSYPLAAVAHIPGISCGVYSGLDGEGRSISVARDGKLDPSLLSINHRLFKRSLLIAFNDRLDVNFNTAVAGFVSS